MGLVKAVNYTNKMAWFRETRGELRFICHVKDFDPRTSALTYIDLVDVAIQRGAEITVHRKAEKNSKYVNIEAVMEISGQIHRAIGMSVQTATVNCITGYVEKLTHDKELETTKNQ
jgi:hypothetical protein